MDKVPTKELFQEVAPKYEFLNSLLTAGMDKHWRETMLSIAESILGEKPHHILDLATGTGDVPRMMTERWPQAKIIATDPTPAMLEIAKTRVPHEKNFCKIEWKAGVAERIELPKDSVNLITIAFGFRNVVAERHQETLEEAFRVLKPGGVMAILELGLPSPKAVRGVYKMLLKHAMPNVAGLFSPKAPYQYLAKSIQEFPEPEKVKKMLAKVGFIAYAPKPLSMGMCWLYIGRKNKTWN